MFQRCQLTFTGMGECIGLSALEAESAARMMRVPRRRHPGLLDDLQIMAAATVRAMNSRKAGTRSA